MTCLINVKVILFSMFIYLVSFVSSAWSQTPPTFFGMDIHPGVLSTQPWPSVPLGSIRLWDTATRWSDLEPSRGVYNWVTLDGYLALAQAHNIDVLYTFGGTAAWAASGSGPQCAYTLQSCYPPSNMQDWDQFVTALVAHSAGRIKYWELWNEANLPAFWSGDVPTLVTLAQHAYSIIKLADPSAVILCPSSTDGSSKVETFLNAYFVAGGLSSTDAVAFHGYVGSKPEEVLYLISRVKATMASNGIAGKPIWDTEGGWGLDSSLAGPNNGPGFLARELLLQWSNGISRVYWYAWNNASWGTLWKTDGIQPSGVAYGQVYSWIEGATIDSPCTMASDSTWTCTFTRSNGDQAQAIWNSTTTESYITASQYTRYLDLGGNINPTHNSVAIGYNPILLVTAAHALRPPHLTAVVRQLQ